MNTWFQSNVPLIFGAQCIRLLRNIVVRVKEAGHSSWYDAEFLKMSEGITTNEKGPETKKMVLHNISLKNALKFET